MASFSIRSITTSSATIRVTGLTVGDSVTIVVRPDPADGTEKKKILTSEDTTLSSTFSGLSPAKDYAANVSLDGGDTWIGTKYFTTNSDEAINASFEISNITATTITFDVSNLESGQSVRFYVVNNETGDYAVDNSYTATGTTMSKTFSGLSPITTYRVNVEINDAYLCGTQTVTTLNENGRPTDWEWISTVAKGVEINLTAAEWNYFTSRINMFRTYAGLSSYNFTKAISGETEISAAIINEARTAISAIDGHGTLPSEVVKGDVIKASIFNDLMDALNAIS